MNIFAICCIKKSVKLCACALGQRFTHSVPNTNLPMKCFCNWLYPYGSSKFTLCHKLLPSQDAFSACLRAHRFCLHTKPAHASPTQLFNPPTATILPRDGISQPHTTHRHHYSTSTASHSEKEAFARNLQNLSPKQRTYYDVLEVKRHDDFETIKKSYIRLAKAYHPDQSKDVNASKRFQEIVEAYSVLSSKWKRPLYDRNLDFGDQTYGVTVDDWKERWSKETEEERLARKERYKRYAQGVRTDFPPSQTLSPPYMLVIVALGAIFLLIIISTAPEKLSDMDAETEATVSFSPLVRRRVKESAAHKDAFDGFVDFHGGSYYNDEETEDMYRDIPYVRAFHNPIANRWERLPDGYDPPSPQDLIQYYQKQFPKFRADHMRIPSTQLTVLKRQHHLKTKLQVGAYCYDALGKNIKIYTEPKVLRTKTSPAQIVRDRVTNKALLVDQIVKKS